MLAILAVLPLLLTLLSGLALRLEPLHQHDDRNIQLSAASATRALRGRRGRPVYYRSSRSLVVGITLTALVLSPAIAVAKFWWGSDNNYVEPRKELAREATRIWHETTGLPLQYVAGSQRYENAVAIDHNGSPRRDFNNTGY